MDSEPTRILVTDDDFNIRHLLREVLLEKGYEVYDAADGLEALKIFKNISIDLVILDIKMPEMDGITALRIMKEINNDIPVIFFTGYGEYKQDFATMASVDFLMKGTADLGEILERINYHLTK